MKNAIGAIILAALLSAGSRYPRMYSNVVYSITMHQTKRPKTPVFVGQGVRSPGAFEFQKGMTVANVIKKAGGVADYPTMIIVRRPTISDPNPKDLEHAVLACKLDRSKPDSGVGACTFKLKPNDLIEAIIPFAGETS